MIDITHDDCGKPAFQVRGQPVGRDIELYDVYVDGIPNHEEADITCSSCGAAISLDEARALVGSIPNGSEVDADSEGKP